jgi:hypothetical protein
MRAYISLSNRKVNRTLGYHAIFIRVICDPAYSLHIHRLIKVTHEPDESYVAVAQIDWRYNY